MIRRTHLCFILTLLAVSEFTLFGESDSRLSLQPRYEEIYESSKEAWKQNRENFTNAWQFSRAAFDMAEFAGSDNQRAKWAEQGIDAGQKAIELEPNEPEGHYYLALNLGQLARTKMLGALRIVRKMEDSFQRAIASGPTFDFAGPHRSLGILYREAPGWPASIGSRSKARFHLKKALEISPEYPGNHLNLIESYLMWSENAQATKAMEQFTEKLKSARKQFSGKHWELSWIEWDSKIANFQSQITEKAADD